VPDQNCKPWQKKLEDEVDALASLTAYLNLDETERMTDALAEAKNIKSLMDVQRIELSGLAQTTISKCEKIRERFEEMVAGEKGIDSGMRSVLRKMKSLLRTSETKLTDAKAAITTLTEKVNKVLASLGVFKGLIQAAKAKEENLEENVGAEATGEILTGLVGSIKNGFGNYRSAKKSR